MKKNGFYSLVLLFVVVYACERKAATAAVKAVPASTKKVETIASQTLPTEPVLAQYMRIKNAMVSDDSLQTKAHIKAYPAIITAAAGAIEENKGVLLVSQLQEQVANMLDSNFEDQRSQLIALTQTLIEWQQFAPAKEKVYVQYCPMYKGGNAWLSMENKVLNPYYGSKMLRCGVVEKTLN